MSSLIKNSECNSINGWTDVLIFNFKIMKFCSRVNVIISAGTCIWNENGHNEKTHKMAINNKLGGKILENAVWAF